MFSGQFTEDHQMFGSEQFTDDLKDFNCLNLFFDKFVNEKSNLPLKILEKAPNLEIMVINYCRSIKILPTNHEAKDRMIKHLKTLILRDAVELQPIGSEDSPWLNTICDQLHELNVYSCHCLTTLVSSAVSFSHMKILDIENCHGLKYLFTSSTAEKFIQLEEIYINDCESMKEIVKGQDETTSEGIKFERLDKIVLGPLSNLECFYSGNATLKLPSLIEVVIEDCPKMKKFSQGSINVKSSFRGIIASSNSNNELFFSGDLNVAAKTLFLHLNHLVLGDYDELQEIWLAAVPVPDGSFSNLKSLVVEGCDFLSNLGVAIPSYLLPFLRKLEELKVQKCNSIEAVFDVEDAHTHDTNMGVASPLCLRLKNLILENLPNLKHIWNEDPQGSISLPFLEQVSVDECKSIKSLFPASVAKGILKTLDVANCEGLVEIVAKDERATKGAIENLTMFPKLTSPTPGSSKGLPKTRVKKCQGLLDFFAKDERATEGANEIHIIFPELTSLTLRSLPNLKCLYPGMHNREWPMLTVLNVYECRDLKVFVTACTQKKTKGMTCLPIDRQGLVSADKVTPHLEELTLNKEDMMMIEQGQLHVDLQKLKILRLPFFVDKSDLFQYVFFSKVPLPSIERLEVHRSDFKEIFPSHRPDIDYNKILSQLKGLELNDLPMLSSIGLEHYWMAPFTQTLASLSVITCNCLTNLLPSTVSFSHLTELIVEDCHGLQYLLTPSTAKSLRVLEKMEITNCRSLKKIVDDEPDDDEMIFDRLKVLSLSCLTRLRSFYGGSSPLRFPSLVQLSFTECRNMRMFCHYFSVPKNLEGMKKWFPLVQ